MNCLHTTYAAPETSALFTEERRPPLGIGFLMSGLCQARHRVGAIAHPGRFEQDSRCGRIGVLPEEWNIVGRKPIRASDGGYHEYKPV